jgi:hypothetical protein
MHSLDNKLEFITRKVSWLELIGLLIKCAILYFYEQALKAEHERKALIDKQQNEAKQSNNAEQQVNLPTDVVL